MSDQRESMRKKKKEGVGGRVAGGSIGLTGGQMTKVLRSSSFCVFFLFFLLFQP